MWPGSEDNKILILVMSVILCKLLKMNPAMPAAPVQSSCAQTSWDTEPTPSLAAEHTHWQQWCQEAAPTCFPLLTWSVYVHMWERGGRICMHNEFSACPAWRRPSRAMENLTSGWQSWWSSKERELWCLLQLGSAQLSSWMFVLTALRCGVGARARLLSTSQRQHVPTDFWSRGKPNRFHTPPLFHSCI